MPHPSSSASSVTQASHISTTGRKRSIAARNAILEATYQILEETGFASLSIEGVAARAGVGKTTIYRWWSGKGALAVEAFLHSVAPMISFPRTASACHDIRKQIHKVGIAYQGTSGRIIREMMGLGQFDPETMRLFVAGYVEPRRAAAKEVLQRGITQGEILDTINLDVVVDALYGPLFHRLLTAHAPVDKKYLDAHLALIMSGIAA